MSIQHTESCGCINCVAEYIKRIAQLEGQFEAAEQHVKILREQVAELQDNNDGLVAAIDSLETDTYTLLEQGNE
jgi:phage shock protein A